MKHHSIAIRIIRSVIATLGLVTLLGMQACGGGSSTPTFTVTVSTGTGGTASATTITVAQGNSTNFTLTPDSGYLIGSASGCGGSLAGTNYTTGAITANCTVTVIFGVDTTGYYINNGSATVKLDNNTTDLMINDLQALVHNNRLMMTSMTNGLLYDGSITINQTDFTGTLTVYRDGLVLLTSVDVIGTITPDSSISGTMSGAGAGNGTFSLNFANTNNQLSAISRIENTIDNPDWACYATGCTAEFGIRIDNAGNVIHDQAPGMPFSSCRMNGVISAISSTSLYAVNVTLTDCLFDGSQNGDYTGLAASRSDVMNDDVLVYFVAKLDNSLSLIGDLE